MSGFSEELLRIVFDKHVSTEESVRKLSEEDQVALANFATLIVKGWQSDGPLSDGDLAAFWVSAFVYGHNWVKDHWVLW